MMFDCGCNRQKGYFRPKGKNGFIPIEASISYSQWHIYFCFSSSISSRIQQNIILITNTHHSWWHHNIRWSAIICFVCCCYVALFLLISYLCIDTKTTGKIEIHNQLNIWQMWPVASEEMVKQITTYCQ